MCVDVWEHFKLKTTAETKAAAEAKTNANKAVVEAAERADAAKAAADAKVRRNAAY